MKNNFVLPQIEVIEYQAEESVTLLSVILGEVDIEKVPTLDFNNIRGMFDDVL